MTTDVGFIVDCCLKKGYNPRIFNLDDLYCDDGHYYKLFVTSQQMIDEGTFTLPLKEDYYIDGVFDLGICLSKYDNIKCSLYRLTKNVPASLFVSYFNGKAESITDSITECKKDCKKHFYNLSKLIDGESIESSVTNYFDVPSPYGECIPVDNYYISSGFESLENVLMETDQTYRTSPFKFKKTYQNKPANSQSNQGGNKVVKRKGGSRRGEVWWVKKLEYGEAGTTNHGYKDRPVIITQIIRGIAYFYMCTSNCFQYFYPKYRLKEPIEDGLSKEPVFVEIREYNIPEEKLDNMVGYLTDTDMDTIFNPSEYNYWGNQYRPIQ